MGWLRAAVSVASLVVPGAGIVNVALGTIPPERAERAERAAALGDHAELALHEPAPVVIPAELASAPPVLEVAPDPPADPESLFAAENTAAGMEHVEAWLHAQIRAESAWRCDAVSPVGAAGCPQFMMPTWGDVAPRTTPSCDGIPRTDPACGFRGQHDYMRLLLGRYDGSPELAAAAYNAGMGHIDKERRACMDARGCNSSLYIGHVEKFCARSAWACRETAEYVRRIWQYAKSRRG